VSQVAIEQGNTVQKNKNVQSKKSKFVRSKKPEQIFKVVAKKPHIPTKRVKKKHKTYTLRTKLSKKTTVLVIGAAVVCAFIVLSISGKQMLDALDATKRPPGSLELSAQAAADLKLLGSKSNYPNEIINYQSAPVDLQEYALRDYTLHKANCIVNGQYVGTLRYEISNVVYDKFARISKDCNGVDSIILSKIGGRWTVIVAGNDLPTCKDVNAFDIPQGISYKCRDGFVTYTNPNP
jgi:hypothetical protein